MAYNYFIQISENSTLFSLNGGPDANPAPAEGGLGAKKQPCSGRVRGRSSAPARRAAPTLELPAGDYADILKVNRRLLVWLEGLAEFCLLHPDPEVRLAFRQMYSAPDIMGRLVRSGSEGQGGYLQSQEGRALLLKAHAALYLALADYLGAGDRYVSLGARLVYLFAAWQAYNLLKTLCADKVQWRDDLRLALAGAYTRLSDLLTEPRFQMAARQMAFWAGIPNPNDPLLRHRLRRSLILTFEGDAPPADPSKIGGRVIPYDKPLPAPGFVPSNPKYPEKENMHPIFSQTEGGIHAARAMATLKLLPRYDFDSTIQIARWLKTPRAAALARWYKYGLLLGWFLVGLVAILIGMCLHSQPGKQSPSWSFGIAAGEFMLLLFAAYFFFVLWFDGFILVHLALPRLVGGVVAGFLLFITQEDSVKLVDAFSLDRQAAPGQGLLVYAWGSGALLVAMLWAGVLLVSLVYLYNDVRAWTLDSGETWQRTGFTLLLAILIASMVSLLGAAILAAAYPPSAQPWGPLVLGPFGFFELRQFFTLTPLALIAGMVSQFILEERTLPASVWSSEQD